jgi:predicted enzyme related to lactoylglutathione lyase
MGAPVMWWEINSNNAAGLQEFYTKLFGWSVNANNPMHYGIVSTGNKKGIGGGIGQNDPNQPAPTPVTFYIAVKKMEDTLNKAVSLGATIVMPVTEIPNMVTMAMFRDPDGNTIGIIKDQAPPKPKKAKKAAKKPAKKSAKKTTRRRR